MELCVCQKYIYYNRFVVEKQWRQVTTWRIPTTTTEDDHVVVVVLKMATEKGSL